MFDIWSSVANLRQPCLHRGVEDRMLDQSGLVRSEILRSLDRLFCEHLASGRASFQAPPAPPPIPTALRFLNTSALQKAIRRGDADGAMYYAQQDCQIDTEHTFRRLAVCAVEDVGIGNLLAVGMALVVMGNRLLRTNGAPDELAAYIAYLLAISPKSRLACDFLSITDYNRGLAPLKGWLSQQPVERLKWYAADRTRPIEERMVAAWLLAGTARYRGITMPKVNRPRTDLMRLMAVSRMPLMLYYIADRAAARIADAMFVSFLFIAEIVTTEPFREIKTTSLDTETIGMFPAVAIDTHTREGRLAISRFGRECAPVRRLLRSVSPAFRDVALGNAVFIAEGGRLGEQVTCPAAGKIEQEAHYHELAFAGILQPADQTELLMAVSTNLAQLNAYRRDVMADVSGL